MSPFYWTKIKKKETCNANLHTLFYTLKLVNSIKLPTHPLATSPYLLKSEMSSSGLSRSSTLSLLDE